MRSPGGTPRQDEVTFPGHESLLRRGIPRDVAEGREGEGTLQIERNVSRQPADGSVGSAGTLIQTNKPRVSRVTGKQTAAI